MNITAIGFANKFYTLWNIYTETRHLGNGHSYIITHYNYIKNISMDKETALTKYPDAEFDENLRGHHESWKTTKEVWDNVDTFRFGKYNGSDINIADNNYLEWYWNQIDGDHKDYVGQVLKSRGYEIKYWFSTTENGKKIAHPYLMSPEELEYERLANIEKNKILEKLNKNEPFEVSFESNPDYNGICLIGHVNYHFQEVNENYYSGYHYYLPVLNGKQKRIKNKNLVIKNYTYRIEKNGSITVEILNFEIKK